MLALLKLPNSKKFQPLLILGYLSLGLTVPFVLPLQEHFKKENDAGKIRTVGVSKWCNFCRI